MIDVALFAFAIEAGGYTEFCKTNECKPPATVMVEADENVRKDRNGWYLQGTAYIKKREQLLIDGERERMRKREERAGLAAPAEVLTNATKAHEYTHHLQRLSNRFHGYRGICNQYGAELEAHTVGNAYLISQGWSYDVNKAVASYKNKCVAAVEAGLVVRPKWM